VNQLHIRVTPQLTKYRRALDGFVSSRIQFAEQNRPFDFSHRFSGVAVSGKLGVRTIG
jgi:hypothetical protein